MPRNPLADVHREMGAILAERAGTPAPARYTDATAEHGAVLRSAGVFDLAPAGKLLVRGPERMRFLDGLLAADLSPLLPGQGTHALLLTREGRIAAEMRVVVLGDAVLLLTPPLARTKILRTLERHLVLTDATVTDASEDLALLSVQGPAAGGVLAAFLGAEVPEISLRGAVAVAAPQGRVTILRSPRTALPGFDVLVPAADAEWTWRRLVDETRTAGGIAAGLEALDALRVESGRPAFGAEFDESSSPSEIPEVASGMGAVSLTKRCFLGAEAVRRDAAAARPARRLAGVLLTGRVPPVRGDRLLAGARTVGRVTSSAFSPGLARGIALAMVEPPCAAPGTVLATHDGDTAEVVALPFATGLHDDGS